MNYVVFLVVFCFRRSLQPISHYFPLDSGKQIVYKAKNLHFAVLVKKRLLTDPSLHQVGWSRANLVKKLRENPKGVTLVLKKIPDSVRRKHPAQLKPTQVSHR